jgi:chromosome partitioning protein
VDNKVNSDINTRIFAFSNQKGGVGKTTTTLAIAAGLSKNGFKTLIIDIDPQGNATSGVGIDKNSQEKTIYHCLHGEVSLSEAIIKTDFENLYLIPSNSSLAAAELELSHAEEREYTLLKLLNDLEEKFEFVLIDSPPSLGLLTVNALTAAEKLIIPLQCEYYSLEGLGDLLRVYALIKKKLNPRLDIGGVILTMADFRAKVTSQVIEEVRKHFGKKVFDSVIPRSVRISEAPSYGQPIVCYDPSSKGARAYLEIVDQILINEGLKEKNQPPAISTPPEAGRQPQEKETQGEAASEETVQASEEKEETEIQEKEKEPQETENENLQNEDLEQLPEKEEIKACFEQKIKLDERLLNNSEENKEFEQENKKVETIEGVNET